MKKSVLNRGKVKTVWSTENPEEVLIEYHDKVTAGNGLKQDFPEGKGELCCQISSLLFRIINGWGIKTHYLGVDGNIMRCNKFDVIPIEVICRNIAAGSIIRQTTIEEGVRFDGPLIEYHLKDDSKNDPLLTEDRIRYMGYGSIFGVYGYVARIDALLRSVFDSMDIDVVDFKLEFADFDGDFVVVDEISPDNMRLWKRGTMEKYDKDLFRNDEGDIMEAYRYILNGIQRYCDPK
jgi:phosphoribosylaminoimidazole-succinocarboxamide synthase